MNGESQTEIITQEKSGNHRFVTPVVEHWLGQEQRIKAKPPPTTGNQI